MNAGISVYIGLEDYPLGETIKYLKYASSLGIEHVFSSAHINEATNSFDELQSMIDECSKLGLKLTLDISKPMYEKLGTLKRVYSFRLDYGFSNEEIVNLSNSGIHKIELNASTISKAKLQTLIDLGLNLSETTMSFNFYPKLYTGHSIDDVYEKTQTFRELGMTVAAFIPSKINFRPPMYEGLPTVEAHRHIDTALAIEELKACGIDTIYFGDAYATEEELKLLVHHNTSELMLKFNPKCKLTKLDPALFALSHKIRPDYNDLMLRLSATRNKEVITVFNVEERNYLDVTIDNQLFKRYAGEINIILKPLPKDNRVNVIGNIDATDVILAAIKKGKSFKFEIIEKEVK